jgi:hypothetical protein
MAKSYENGYEFPGSKKDGNFMNNLSDNCFKTHPDYGLDERNLTVRHRVFTLPTSLDQFAKIIKFCGIKTHC